MQALQILLDGDSAWPDLEKVGYLHGDWEGVTALADGTAKGKPTVAVRVKLPDGRYVLAETTLVLFVMAARAFIARYGDPALEKD